jgi:hypothetical protein
MKKVALVFEVSEETLKRLIPSVSIDAEIYAGNPGTALFVTDNKEGDQYYQGFSAEIRVLD